LKAFKRGLSFENSTWYKGVLTTELAAAKQTGGAFEVITAHVKAGTEPPPHVHSREHEFFYLLEGVIDVYVGSEVFRVWAGESIFLPKGVPHAVRGWTPEYRILVFLTPGGFMSAIQSMAMPAERLEIPSDMQTYATADLGDTVKVLDKYGVRFLSPEEIAEQMPDYAVPQPV
jgi:quercetin dioxygenase-like cupin family protein